MFFDLTKEQAEFRATVHDTLALRGSGEPCRTWDGERVVADGLWQELARIGVHGLLVPENVGGHGASTIELVLALEEAGWCGVPGPLAETAGVVAPVLAAFATDEVRATWLPSIACGGLEATVQFDAEHPVAHGVDASRVLVVADGSVHWIDGQAVDWTPVASQDPTRRLAVGRPPVDRSTLVTSDPRAVSFARDSARIATAALLVGNSRRLLELTLAHVSQRVQFGRTLGSFQAVKHSLANLAVQIEAARSLVWYAGYTHAQYTNAQQAAARELRNAATMALASAAVASRLANSDALQFHGGIGYSWDHDLHLPLKRGKALEYACDTYRQLRTDLGARLLEEGVPS